MRSINAPLAVNSTHHTTQSARPSRGRDHDSTLSDPSTVDCERLHNLDNDDDWKISVDEFAAKKNAK